MSRFILHQIICMNVKMFLVQPQHLKRRRKVGPVQRVTDHLTGFLENKRQLGANFQSVAVRSIQSSCH